MPDLRSPPLSLYVHLPWCVRKCPYCDFNSHAAPIQLPESNYIKALLCDLEQDLASIQPRPLQSIFIGGGTPSLFAPESLGQLLEGIAAKIDWESSIEITLEANPGTVEISRFKEFASLGINRLSLGIQSFQTPKLQALGRIHSAQEALQAVTIAQRAGFSQINLDLMFGLPGQSLEDSLQDIGTAIDLRPHHISYYQLTLEPNTLFAKYPPPLPSDDKIWRIQQRCLSQLAEQGYERYEVSAFAKAGSQCRHNLNYWQFGDYLGIGAGAHGKITLSNQQTVIRYAKIRHPQHYMQRADLAGRIASQAEIPPSQRPLEFLMNSLRLTEGFTPIQFEQRTGLPFAAIETEIEALCAEGLIQQNSGERLSCTTRGWDFLDTVLQRFA